MRGWWFGVVLAACASPAPPVIDGGVDAGDDVQAPTTATLRVRLTTTAGKRTMKFHVLQPDGGIVFAHDKVSKWLHIDELLENMPVGRVRLLANFVKPEFHYQFYDLDTVAGEQVFDLVQQPSRVLAGTVTHAGKPVVGAVVVLSPTSFVSPSFIRHAVTDSTGRFELISAIAAPYTAACRGVSVDEPTDGGALVLEVPEQRGGIRGRVRGPRALYEGKLLLLNTPVKEDEMPVEAPLLDSTFRLGADGVFAFPDAPPGKWVVRLTEPASNAFSPWETPTGLQPGSIDGFFPVESPSDNEVIDLARTGTVLFDDQVDEGVGGWLMFPSGAAGGLAADHLPARVRLPAGRVAFECSYMDDHCERLSATVVVGKETRIWLASNPKNAPCKRPVDPVAE